MIQTQTVIYVILPITVTMNESHLEGVQDAFTKNMKEAITAEMAGKDL
jgi:hypothetical protein